MRRFYLAVALLFVQTVSFGQAFNYYAGNLHAHTAYSDGNKDAAVTNVKTPKSSFAFAKKSEQFDFLGISEHNHSQAKMRLANYAKGLKEAGAATTDKFLCLYGMEYGVISKGGHVLIYGVDQLIGWEKDNFDIECEKTDYIALWDILVEHPNAFATLAHPEKSDFENLLNGPYNKTADKVICGVAIMTGPAFAEETDYSRKPSKKFVDYYRRLLAAGYHVGPTVDHDNHFLTFGRMASSRTIVLAPKLDRKNIMSAYREMRFYASEDWNTEVSFVLNGFPIGKMINTKSKAHMKIEVNDPDDGDEVALIKVMHGQPGSGTPPSVLTKSNTSTIDFVHDLSAGEEFYYYLEITQTDGDKIYTSPIWVRRIE